MLQKSLSRHMTVQNENKSLPQAASAYLLIQFWAYETSGKQVRNMWLSVQLVGDGAAA